MDDYMKLDSHFVALHEDELEFLTDLAVNESQRWIEAVTHSKFRLPDFLESLEDGVLLCELVDRIWPWYLKLDDGSSHNDSYARLYGQRSLEAFRGAAEKIGLEENVIFQHRHIHAPERYICTPDAEEAIQEALIRVTVSIYLLGWRAKETPTFPGPYLDLTAFDQLFQHYLRHLHNNSSSLCNRDLIEADSLGSPDSEVPQDSLEDDNPDSLDEPNALPEDTAVTETMPSQEMDELDDSYRMRNQNHDGEVYRLGRSGYYADSVGSSCDSACGSTSPSTVEPQHTRQRSVDGDEFVKAKDSSGTGGGGGGGARHSVGRPAVATAAPIDLDAIKKKLKEDELEWEASLSSWKNKRKSHLTPENSVDQTEEKSAAEKNLRTFPTMIASRLQSHGIPALYSDDDNIYRDDRVINKNDSHPNTITAVVDQTVITAQHDSSEKDSSSGISSPRSSRSLTSVSPPPYPTPQSHHRSELVVKQQDTEEAIFLPPPPPPPLHSRNISDSIETPPRKIISLVRANSGDSCVNDWKILGSPNSAEDDEAKNPNVETSIKPFGEKLAMFEKAKTDSTVLDMNKCNYKDLAKPEQSLRDKLSVFKSLEVTSQEHVKDHHPAPVSVKSQLAPFQPPDPVSQPATTQARSETSSGGLSRLLSKDLHNSNVGRKSLPNQPLTPRVPEKETSLSPDITNSERLMEEIDGILGGDDGKSRSVPPSVEDFPPPPLPNNPPPVVAVEFTASDHEVDHENRFPTPPPPMIEDTEDDADNSQHSSLYDSDLNVVPLRRTDSAKRLKSELSKRRSDYFGLKDASHGSPISSTAASTTKPRPVSLHEPSIVSKAAVTTAPAPNKSAIHTVKETLNNNAKVKVDADESDDIEREQKSLSDSIALEEERWRKEDGRPIMRTQDSAVAAILEEYRREMVKEREDAIHHQKREKEEKEAILQQKKERRSAETLAQKEPPPPVRKDSQQAGILKRPVLQSDNAAKTGPASRSVDIPITVEEKSESRVVTKSDNGNRVVVVERFEKVTEERRRNGRIEASSTEERRSVDHLTPDGEPATNFVHSVVSLPPVIQTPLFKPFFHASQEQHYRDPSDGGYSSGRSDPGANVRTWLSQHPVSSVPPSVPDSRDYPVTAENGPPRPPLPAEFRPTIYSEPYQAQYASKPAPLPPGRMQPKTEQVKKTASPADVQKHWLVQEAEMRRLADAETRQRAAAVAPPVPMRMVGLAEPKNGPFSAYDDRGSKSESSTLNRPSALPYTQNKNADQYSSINRTVLPQTHKKFEEERYNQMNPPAEIRTVMRSIGPISNFDHVSQPVVHRPNHPPAPQPTYLPPSGTPKYPTTHIPAHQVAAASEHQQLPKIPPNRNNYYSQDPVLLPHSHSVPNVSAHQQLPKPYVTPSPAVIPPPYNRQKENVAPQNISSKWPCARCGEFLGGNPAMIVENLKLVYHVACFKCVVCGQRLSDGREGADVKVRDGRLHCNACVSDEGMHMTML